MLLWEPVRQVVTVVLLGVVRLKVVTGGRQLVRLGGLGGLMGLRGLPLLAGLVGLMRLGGLGGLVLLVGLGLVMVLGPILLWALRLVSVQVLVARARAPTSSQLGQACHGLRAAFA